MKRLAAKLVLALLFSLLAVSFASANGQKDNDDYRQEQNGYGMMGGNGSYGMMGSNGYFGNNSKPPAGDRLTIEKVNEKVLDFLKQRRMDGLEINEIMEFQNNFYAQIRESDTRINAFELLIDPYYGYVGYEPGPNMMWNSKYGRMGGWTSKEMSLSAEDAISQASKFLAKYSPGLSIEQDADEFYGYYTIHTLKDGKVEGMLSVNGFSGDVWYHNWHGPSL